jgi:hypothetical protein
MLAAMALTVRIMALVAVGVVCVWFAIGVRQARDTNLATAIITGSAPLSPAQARRASALLNAAGQLNPDLAVDLLRAQLALREGLPARARAIALSVAHSEPQDLDAWLAYGTASSDDARAFRLALDRLQQLAPTVGHGG